MFSTLGCSIKGSFQGLYSYQNKTAQLAPNLIRKPNLAVCSLTQLDTPIVYAVNGVELRHCIKPFEKALVYLWKPKCFSDFCISPNDMQLFCQKNNMELFILAEYYDYKMMSIKYSLKRPIFGVDCNYYSNHLTEKYIYKFMKDLLGQEINLNNNHFFLFNYGVLTDMSMSLSELRNMK